MDVNWQLFKSPLIFKEFIKLLLFIKRKLVHLTSSLSWGLPYIALTYVSFRLLYASRFPCSFLSWISWCRKTVSILTVRFIQASVRRGLELLIATCNFLKRISKYDQERIKFFWLKTNLRAQIARTIPVCLSLVELVVMATFIRCAPGILGAHWYPSWRTVVDNFIRKVKEALDNARWK